MDEKDKLPETPLELKKYGHMLIPDKLGNNYFWGRTKELQKISIILNKSIKNNLLIIGNPGVGKTSLVEAYALRHEEIKIFVVECAKLIAGTEYRGSFEQVVLKLLNFAKTNGLILFFDELHVLVDLGKSQGGISITDILKPYLLDQKMAFIGATTIEESKLLTKAKAFQRRFSVIFLEEPSELQLCNITRKFEDNVANRRLLTDNELTDTIENLRVRVPLLYFPDKLIDFLDYKNACQKIRTGNIDNKEILEEYINDQRMATAEC